MNYNGIVSSIITGFSILIYLVSHIWRMSDTDNNQYEFIRMYSDTADNFDGEDHVIDIDRGEMFYLSSSQKIRSINFYSVRYDFDESSNLVLQDRIKLDNYGTLHMNEELYIRCDVGELYPKIQLEIERENYSVICYNLRWSGKNSNVFLEKVDAKNNFKSIVYRMIE